MNKKRASNLLISYETSVKKNITDFTNTHEISSFTIQKVPK